MKKDNVRKLAMTTHKSIFFKKRPEMSKPSNFLCTWVLIFSCDFRSIQFDVAKMFFKFFSEYKHLCNILYQRQTNHTELWSSEGFQIRSKVYFAMCVSGCQCRCVICLVIFTATILGSKHLKRMEAENLARTIPENFERTTEKQRS